MHRTRLLVQVLRRGQCRHGGNDIGGREDGSAVTAGGSRMASARLSSPHSPHPLGPARRRRRTLSASIRLASIHKRSSMPWSVGTMTIS
jgi:hypothetical protein